MKKIIVWDWNGTLLYDVPLNIEILNHILLESNLKTINYDEYINLFCFPIKTFYQKLGFCFQSEKQYANIIDKFNRIYRKRMFAPQLQVGALEVLTEFNKRSYSQILLSGLNHIDLITQVKYHNLFGFFDKIVGSNTNDAKDKDYNLKRIIRSYNTENDIILIGDTIADLRLSVDNNCKPLLVTCGHQSINAISTETTLYCNSLFDIIKYICV